MVRFLLVRVLQSIPVLFVMSLITFVIINAPPGDYGDYIRTNMITQGNASFAAADAAAERYREEHGLNDPLIVQYFRWIGGIVTRGDFGWSYFYNRPVSEVVGERLPRTIALALTCHLLASVFGIGFGILAATRQYSWIDTALSFISFLGMTIPRFLLALIILYVLAFKLNVQEIGSFYSSQYGGAPWSWGKFVNLVQHVWPVVFVATIGGLAYNMRVMRGNLLDTLNAQYVETARAKGLSEGAVIMKHAVPNALHPLVAYQGVVLPYMLTGEIEVAIVFALATIGPAIVSSMSIGDVNVTATLLLVLGATLIVGNIIADLLLVAARSAHPRGERRMTDRAPPAHRGPARPRAQPRRPDRARGRGTTRRSRCRPSPRTPGSPPSRPRARATSALVWRRFRKSVPGMIGLVMVVDAAHRRALRRLLRAGEPERARTSPSRRPTGSAGTCRTRAGG